MAACFVTEWGISAIKTQDSNTTYGPKDHNAALISGIAARLNVTMQRIFRRDRGHYRYRHGSSPFLGDGPSRRSPIGLRATCARYWLKKPSLRRDYYGLLHSFLEHHAAGRG